MNNELTVQDLMLIIGEQHVSLVVERTRVARATELITALQARVASLEAAQTPDTQV